MSHVGQPEIAAGELPGPGETINWYGCPYCFLEQAQSIQNLNHDDAGVRDCHKGPGRALGLRSSSGRTHLHGAICRVSVSLIMWTGGA
jgi:hypothetical protein